MNAFHLFRPCIDLHKGQVKQVVGSSLHNKNGVKENFVARFSASRYARLFRRAKLAGGHVVMLGGGNGKACAEILKQWPQAFDVGGGMDMEKAKHWLALGARRIIFTSYLFSDDGLHLNCRRLENLVKHFSRDKIVIDLSCKQMRPNAYYAMTKQWKITSKQQLSPALFSKLYRYASGFLVHAIDQEGKKIGMDEQLVALLAKAVECIEEDYFTDHLETTNNYSLGKEENYSLQHTKEWRTVDMVYAGGIATLADVEKLVELGKGKVAYTIGSALSLYGGALPWRQLIERRGKN